MSTGYSRDKHNGNGGFSSGIWESYSHVSQERWDAIFGKKEEEVKEEDKKDNG